MDELLTILISTKNRYKILDRSLSYFSKVNVTFKIIVADSSDSVFGDSVKVVCEKYNTELNIDYFHAPADIEVSDKNFIAMERTSTPYVLALGDDDFPLISSIKLILTKLEEDKSIVAAFGNRVAVKQISKKASNKKWIKTYPNYSGISISNNNPLDRIKRLPIPNWQQYGNAIFRTHVFNKASKIVRKLKHTQYSEFFFFSMVVAYGKWVKYDFLFTVCNQESKFCHFKDRYLFPHYIGSGGSVLSGISQNDWSKTVSSLCDIVGKELATANAQDGKDVSFQIRKIYYSKLIYFLENNTHLSDNLIDNDSAILRKINHIFRGLSRFYWVIILYDKSGGINEFIQFLFGLIKEIINGRFIRLALKSTTSSSIKDLLISIKRTGSLDYESDVLLHASSKYHKEYKIIFDVWTKDPCPQQLEENLHNN
jgi:glycosyltransferase domain-containing protein